MAAVGDIIVRVRENGPDPASFLGKPSFALDGTTGGGSIPANTYYIVLSALNPWGESAATDEQSIALSANHILKIKSLVFAPGTTAYRIYFSTTPGGQNGYILVNNLLETDLSALPTLLPGVPPTRATAMMPDSDGSYVSAFTVYRWLNSALSKAAKIGGGLPLLTGVQAQAGQAMYRISGRWIHFSRVWFDGWIVASGKKADVFLHNAMTAISGLSTMEETVDTTVFQMWPQPNRTGSTTTLGPQLSATATAALVADSSGFLPLGLIRIDDEIIGYSTLGTGVIQGLLRGLSGTLAAVHGAGSTVTELNIRLSGFGMPVDYVVGDSLKTLPLPPAWEEPLTDYLTAQFRKSELDTQAALLVEKQFEESIRKVAKESRFPTKPAQIGGVTRETLPGSISGGIILP